MRQILSSAHVHTTFCDGKSTAHDMAQMAYKMGFVSLGFTSHAPQMFDSAHCIAPSREGDYKRLSVSWRFPLTSIFHTNSDMVYSSPQHRTIPAKNSLRFRYLRITKGSPTRSRITNVVLVFFRIGFSRFKPLTLMQNT